MFIKCPRGVQEVRIGQELYGIGLKDKENSV